VKRRDFLLKSGGLLGAIIPAAAIGQVRPCPPDLTGGSSSGCGQGQSEGAPAWFASLRNLEAAAPVTNWLGASGAKDPGSGLGNHAGIITAWTGMGIDQRSRTAFMMHNGGHSDYFGNEVYSVDLSDESPAWIRRRDASTPTGSGDVSAFADGRPSSDHTGGLYVAAEGRWFTCGMNSRNYNGGSDKARWWEYDPVIDDYIDLGSNHVSGGGQFGTAVYDKNARHAITIHVDNVSGANVSFTSLDNMEGPPDVGNYNWLGFNNSAMAAVDTTNKILLMRMGNDYRFLKIDSDTNRQASYSTVSASGSAPSARNQIYWHEPSQAFITWGGGNSIAKLTPTVSDGSYTSLTWSRVSVNGTSLPSSGPPAGMWDKVNLIENMGNADSALVIVPRYANPDTYVIRIIGST